MSIAVSSRVWKFSRHKSGNLLVLLAVADHADEEGNAWPGIDRLARMTRLSDRHVRRCLNALLETGELEIMPESSPSGGTLYRIRLEFLAAEIGTATPTKVTPASGVQDVHVTPSIREPSEETSLETDSHSLPAKIRKISLRPKIDEVLQFASQTKDLDAEVAEIWWHECEACGWIDSHRRPIIKWQSALIAYCCKWTANNHTRKQPAAFGDSARKKNAPQPAREPAKLSSAAKNGF
jgi:hypothetical protein